MKIIRSYSAFSCKRFIFIEHLCAQSPLVTSRYVLVSRDIIIGSRDTQVNAPVAKSNEVDPDSIIKLIRVR